MKPKIYGDKEAEEVFVKLREERGSIFVTLVNKKGKKVAEDLVQIISGAENNIGVILLLHVNAAYTGDIIIISTRRDLE